MLYFEVPNLSRSVALRIHARSRHSTGAVIVQTDGMGFDLETLSVQSHLFNVCTRTLKTLLATKDIESGYRDVLVRLTSRAG